VVTRNTTRALLKAQDATTATGTGKEVMARAIHDLSPRRQRRMITVNYAAIPPTLILEAAVSEKTFREDLYYRLNVFPIVVPPLRERIDDIPALAWTFVDEFARSCGKTIESISEESLRELQRYRWPGNVRELRNVIERAVILATGPELVAVAPRVDHERMPRRAMTLTELEASHIRAVLASTEWRARGSGGAAERLGLKPTTLESRMARLGIERTKPGGPAPVEW
jgi:transcriptional regulator with GAF, ATPase, and Fis domain